MLMGMLGLVVSLSWPYWVIGNGPHVLGNGSHVLCNGPHSFTQFMNRVLLIMGRLGWVVCLSWPYTGLGKMGRMC